MITCPNCGHQNENVKFCSNCGTELDQSQAVNPETSNQPKAPNETAEKLKATSQNYGKFFMEYLKKPSNARFTTENDFINGLITIAAFVLIATILSYISITANYPFGSPSFMDAFFKPLVSELILYAVIPVLIFGAYFNFIDKGKNIQQFYAKFGAYLIPFALVFIVGELFSLLDIGVLSYVAATIGSTGVLLMIPTLILFEQDSESKKGLDRVYALFISVAAILLVNYLLGSVFTSSGTELDFFDIFS